MVNTENVENEHTFKATRSVKNWLTKRSQRATIRGTSLPVTCGASQGLVLGPQLFANLYQ